MHQSQAANRLRPREWDSLLQDIENEQCILILGSSLATADYNGQTLPLNEICALHLAEELEIDGIVYDQTQKQNLPYITQKFLSIPNVTRTDLEFEISETYKKHTLNIPSVYQELAKFPFHFIINTNIDNFMLKALHREGKAGSINLDYNFKKDKEPTINTISKETPLVYNLFGSVNDSDSIVLTTIDQVEFIRNIVRDEPPLPLKIRNQFDKRKTYVFVDFDINHWQFRLLFDALQLQKENKILLPSTIEYNSLTKDFFEHRFNFRFLNKHFTDFLSQLTEKYNTPSIVSEIPNQTYEKNIFIAFTREDKAVCEKLEQFMVNKKVWRTWHQDKIPTGSDKNIQIKEEIIKADVIIPILSANFFSKENFVERFEIEQLIKSNSNKKIIPILAKSCDWKSTIYKDLFILPSPINSIDTSANTENIYQQILEDITKIIS